MIKKKKVAKSLLIYIIMLGPLCLIGNYTDSKHMQRFARLQPFVPSVSPGSPLIEASRISAELEIHSVYEKISRIKINGDFYKELHRPKKAEIFLWSALQLSSAKYESFIKRTLNIEFCRNSSRFGRNDNELRSIKLVRRDRYTGHEIFQTTVNCKRH